MVEQDRDTPGFIEELKRRRVVRVALGYLAISFGLLQMADVVFPALDLSDGAVRLLLVVLLGAFGPVLLLSWLFDVTREGVVRSGRVGEAGRLVVSGRWMVVGGVVLLVSVAGGFGTLVLRPSVASGEVSAGAEVIAVMPFRATGGDLEVLGEGLGDLLARNLDEVGAIRTVDPRTVLSRLSQEEARSGPTEQRALEVARGVGAGSVLTGSVVSLGSQVRLTAELRTVEGGRRLADVTLDGSPERLLGMVDSLSFELLRDIWQSGAAVPRFNVAGITTANLSAIRAFLEGERHYRASRWDSALVSFGRAVEADSTFALAYYRLAGTAGWGGALAGVQSVLAGPLDPGSDLEAQASARAVALSDRLPQRERLLVVAQSLRSSGRRGEAADSLRAFLQRYPDDVEARYFLADDRYHLLVEGAGPIRPEPREQVTLFDQVLEKEPSFHPALLHPLEVAFDNEDPSLARRYLPRLDPNDPLDAVALSTYEAGLRALESHDIFGYSAALERAFQDLGSAGLLWQASNTIVEPLTRAAARLPAVEKDQLITILQGGMGEDPRRVQAVLDLLIASGRIEEARGLLTQPAVARALGEEGVRAYGSLPVEAGWAGPAELPTDAGPATEMAAAILAALDARDARALQRLPAAAGAAAEHPDSLGELAAWAAAAREAVEGSGGARLKALEAELGRSRLAARTRAEPFWFRWLALAAREPETRDRVLPALRRPWPGSPVFEIQRLALLAEAEGAVGNASAAAAVLDTYCGAVAGADPGVLGRGVAGGAAPACPLDLAVRP